MPQPRKHIRRCHCSTCGRRIGTQPYIVLAHPAWRYERYACERCYRRHVFLPAFKAAQDAARTGGR